MAKGDYTTIMIAKTTRLRLLQYGKFQESYDDLLNRLMDVHPREGKKA